MRRECGYSVYIVWRSCADNVDRFWNECGESVARVRVKRVLKVFGASLERVWIYC